jgi:hypothetical protein
MIQESDDAHDAADLEGNEASVSFDFAENT